MSYVHLTLDSAILLLFLRTLKKSIIVLCLRGRLRDFDHLDLNPTSTTCQFYHFWGSYLSYLHLTLFLISTKSNISQRIVTKIKLNNLDEIHKTLFGI